MASTNTSTAAPIMQWSQAACAGKYQDLRVEVERQRGIALVTLNRPPMNSVTMRMHKELASIWPDLTPIPKSRYYFIYLFIYFPILSIFYAEIRILILSNII